MHSLRYIQEDDPVADPSVQVIGWSLRGAGKRGQERENGRSLKVDLSS